MAALTGAHIPLLVGAQNPEIIFCLLFFFSSVFLNHFHHPPRHKQHKQQPSAPALLPHHIVTTTLGRCGAGAKGHATQDRKARGREAHFPNTKWRGWVVAPRTRVSAARWVCNRYLGPIAVRVAVLVGRPRLSPASLRLEGRDAVCGLAFRGPLAVGRAAQHDDGGRR